MIARQRCAVHSDILLVMVPGMGMGAEDFETKGMTAAVTERGWPVAMATVDPGPDAYLDGSIETRMLDGIIKARQVAEPTRIWLAGISLGCNAILRCVRARPGLVEGLILLTPYLASTGLIAEVNRAGGLRRWSASNNGRREPERALLMWLATTPLTDLPLMLVGRADGDRFAGTASLLADLLPADQLTSVPGGHDWASWQALWQLILAQDPFARRPAVVP